ncbi:MAG: redoxin domain-containing protein [Verrucomicrobiota bacterium]|nr:redoxin domain-containing protein [Verrucomicrobiota bacterium]
MLSIGEKINTAINLKVVHRGLVEAVLLRDLLTRRTIVSVYMRNNTGSCDKQNTSLASHAAELDKAGYNLIAVSRDTTASHLKYAAKLGISYSLVSDPDDIFAKAVDSIVEKSMYGKKYLGPARAAYVFDTEGTLIASISKVDSANHGDELLALIQKL